RRPALETAQTGRGTDLAPGPAMCSHRDLASPPRGMDRSAHHAPRHSAAMARVAGTAPPPDRRVPRRSSGSAVRGLVLAVMLLPAALAAQQADASVDPYTRGERQALSAARYIGLGPFP